MSLESSDRPRAQLANDGYWPVNAAWGCEAEVF